MVLENIKRGGISAVCGDRYQKSDENKKILLKKAKNLYGWAMSEYPPHDEIQIDRNFRLEDTLSTPDDSDIGYFIEVDLKDPDNIKEKTKHFPFSPKNKKINPDDFSDHMREIKPDTYTQTKELICYWSDKKNCLVQ